MSKILSEELQAYIRDVPDFPKPGILFKDITPVLQNPELFARSIELMAEHAQQQGATAILGIESRGFIFGAPIAVKLNLPFTMARKLGKLPYDKLTEEYALEYGTNTVELHTDAVSQNQNIYIVDDLLATGGTAAAASRLVERLNGNVCGLGFLVELTYLKGRENLLGYPIHTLIEF